MHYSHQHHNAPGTAMATMKPRITITLNERQHAVLRSISENSGQSMSAFVGEVLEQALPILERMAETFRKIKTAQDVHRARIASELEEAQAAVEPIVAQAIGQFDLFSQRIEAAMDVVPGNGRMRPSPAPLPEDPRPVITGVRSPVPSKKKSPKTRTATGSQAKRRTGVSP